MSITNPPLELDTIREAINVGPEDQSLWFYHQYLMLNLTQAAGDSSIAPHLTLDERKEYLLGEIADIKDLLDDYHDIKWIYEALVEYTAAVWELNGHHQPAQQDGNDVTGWLTRLRQLDPMRIGRWNDLEEQLRLSTARVQ